MYTVFLRPPARKQLRKLPHEHQVRVTEALKFLAAEPFAGKKMRGDLQDRYTLRVWPYRIIYAVHKKEILVIVLAIGHRQGVY